MIHTKLTGPGRRFIPNEKYQSNFGDPKSDPKKEMVEGSSSEKSGYSLSGGLLLTQLASPLPITSLQIKFPSYLSQTTAHFLRPPLISLQSDLQSL